ncbi:hypothetical protein EXIGUO8H_200001 [Exiguobacterium sp. 8H]|nr:hypothetical protein EXIGUO8H_200001 [Exiguobacterium sp. 8H]VXC25072.1 hypothetical protein EXIGUO8A_830001 [Exiguobacterium sp. 8A]
MLSEHKVFDGHTQTTIMSKNLHMVAAVDIGNADVKVETSKGGLVAPNAISSSWNYNFGDMTALQLAERLLDHLVVEISSSAIHTLSGPHAVGKAAFSVGTSSVLMTMPIDGTTVRSNKHENEQSAYVTHALLAASLLRDHVDQHGDIPKRIDATITLGTAIPAMLWAKNKAHARQLEQQLLGDHLVTIWLGDERVRVSLDYQSVKVTSEGVIALYALDQNIRKQGNLIVDIGEGTTEYAFTDGGAPVPALTSGSRNGVGHALEGATESYARLHQMEYSRHTYKAKMKSKKDYALELRKLFENHKRAQAQEIAEQTERQLTLIERDPEHEVENIILIGGGAVVFHEELEQSLLPIVSKWDVRLINGIEDSVILNLKGLYILAKQLEAQRIEEGVIVE